MLFLDPMARTNDHRWNIVRGS